jgi:DNA-binding transcriptional regulator YhcF (GntR family)
MAGPRAAVQFAQVRSKIDEGMPVGAAIKAVAQETGVSANTLQTVYYRVAHETGVIAHRKRARPAKSARQAKATRRVGRPRATAEPSTAELLRQLAATATALAARVDELERAGARLRDVEAAFSR